MPEGMHYDCIQCGRGCTDFWEIPVDAESERHLEQFDLKTHQQRAQEGDPFVPSEFDPADRALNRVNDVCTFLCGDKKCALHAALGPKIKPQTCIDFPYRFVDTPAGTYVGLTFACTAVRQNTGGLVSEKGDALRDNYADSIHVKEVASKPRLTGRIEIDFEAYLELEKALEEILRLPRQPIARRLLSQSVFIDLVSKTFETARLNAPGPDLTEQERNIARQTTDAKLVEALANRFRADNWGKLLLMAEKQRPSPMIHRAIVGLITTFRQALWRDFSRVKALLYIFRHYLTHAVGITRLHLEPLNRRFRFSDFRIRHVQDEPGSFYDELLTRYFLHVLFRKDLLQADNIRAAHRFQLMNFALVRWYLVGLMVEGETREATDEMVEEALCNVEKYYVHHTAYTKFLERQPVLGTLVDSAIHTARYAASMVHSPA